MLLKISKFLLYLVPLSLVIVYQGTVFPFIVGKYVFFRAIVDLALIFFVLHLVSTPARNNAERIHGAGAEQRGKENKFTNLLKQPLVISVALFSLIYVLAGFFGINPAASFWSNFERGEGSLQIIHLFVFFILLNLVFSTEGGDNSWKKLMAVSIWSGILMVLYGVLGALGINGFMGLSLCSRFAGSLGNPAYTGTVLIFMIFYAAYLANESTEKIMKYLLSGLAGLFFIFLLLTQTRGALLGLGVAVVSGLVYLYFNLTKGKVKNIILLITILLVVCGGLAIKFRSSIDIMPFCQAESGGNRILNVDLGTETFQTRLSLWQESINAFKERPILGWGPENFTVAFEKYYKPQFTTWYDRAHNIFFDYLVMTGLLGLLSFVSIFGVYYWQFFKLTHNEKQITNNKNQLSVISYQLLISNTLFFALPIAYLVQGLVLFDILSIYVNLFLFLAFANWKLTSN